MSLVRAFTTRLNKADELTNIHMGRAASQRGGKPVLRDQISSPVALISTTNPLSYDAPSIAGTLPIGHRNVSSTSTSSADSSHSAEDSDASTLSINTCTDASSVDDNSPISTEPEPNHLSCYFKPAVDTTSLSRSPSLSSRPTSADAPAIPRRVPSHSKKAHEQLHRKRSIQRMMSPPASIVGRNSADIFHQSVDTPMESPFESELAQLDEVQEDFSHAVRGAEHDVDAAYMSLHGLAHFGASDYLAEIHSLLYDSYLAEETVWI